MPSLTSIPSVYLTDFVFRQHYIPSEIFNVNVPFVHTWTTKAVSCIKQSSEKKRS
jgi:hypothetical protein